VDDEVVVVLPEEDVVELELFAADEVVDDDEQAETAKANTTPTATGMSSDRPRTCIHPLR
jgi:hypothetical protein